MTTIRDYQAAVAKRRGRGEKDTMQALFSAGVVHSL